MTTVAKSQWEGRLGIEVVGDVQGCCVQSMFDWNAQYLGKRIECPICNNALKTVRAGDDLDVVSTGFLSDLRKVEKPDFILGGLYFSAEKFAKPGTIEEWFKDRDCGEPSDVATFGEEAYYVPIADLDPASVRYVRVAPGVLGEVGLAEKDGPTGAGQASMSSPAITTTSMASGGTLDPAQGPAHAIAAASGMPMILHGMTEVQDGHQHEYHLTPYPGPNGFCVKGFTSFVDGHAHMIETELNPDGSFDIRTGADQAQVGGHAHSHRTTFSPVSTMKSKASEEKPGVPEGWLSSFKEGLDAAVNRALGKSVKKAD